MSRRVICTVGTSLLTNGDRPWSGWRPGQPLPDRLQVFTWMKDASLETTSAETNTLRALELDQPDRLVLLYSDTDEGRFCAEVLRDLYQTRGLQVMTEKIAELGYGARVFTRGLKGLVDVALRHIRDANEKSQTPTLCATGGFKAEIAFLNVLGALIGVEVVYLHERHRELVRLPPLPLAWNDDFVSQHEDFFQWIDEEPRRTAEVESWLKACPDLRFFVEDDGNGHTMLTAAGDLLYRVARERRQLRPRAEWPPLHLAEPAEKNKLSDVAHHRPHGWERVVDRICRIDCVSQVRYGSEARGGPKVSVIDPDKGVLGVRIGTPDAELPLVVETTARGAAQSELVAEYLRAQIR